MRNSFLRTVLNNNHNINIESKMAVLICITEREIVGLCARVVLIMVCGPLSLVMSSGTPKRAIQCCRRAIAQVAA